VLKTSVVSSQRAGLLTVLAEGRWTSRRPAVEFFSKEGKALGNKISLEQDVNEVTRIPVKALRGSRLSEFSVNERMSWAARRKTTRKEDQAYCLFGMFGVFMPLIYGEGEENALLRLYEVVQKRQEKRGIENLRDLLSTF
jgi:hypothetical protein